MPSNSSFPKAVIFDMDGVLIDSNPFHLRKWIDLLNSHRIPFRPEDLPQYVLGQRNDTAFRYFFGPEVYVKVAEKIGLDPAGCVAFEDSFVGVESAKRAGMKCVAIASTFPRDQLERAADLAVPSFESLTLDRLRRLFAGTGRAPEK